MESCGKFILRPFYRRAARDACATSFDEVDEPVEYEIETGGMQSEEEQLRKFGEK